MCKGFSLHDLQRFSVPSIILKEVAIYRIKNDVNKEKSNEKVEIPSWSLMGDGAGLIRLDEEDFLSVVDSMIMYNE